MAALVSANKNAVPGGQHGARTGSAQNWGREGRCAYLVVAARLSGLEPARDAGPILVVGIANALGFRATSALDQPKQRSKNVR